MVSFDVDQFVADCLEAVHGDSAILAVRDVVERAVRDPEALADTLGNKLGKDIGVLHYSPELTVQHNILPPGHRTGIHDHQVWAVIGTWGGHEDNYLYRDDSNQLIEVGVTRCGEKEVLVLGADAIHDVAAPSTTWSAALHVYGGALFDQPRTEWRGSPPVKQPVDEHAYLVRYLEELGTAGLLVE